MRGGMGAPTKLLTALQVLGAAASVSTQGFGPGNCVTVTLSDKGSCLLHTNCLGQDISEFDFSFDCVPIEGGEATTHSLGIGSFDEVEDYDSEVQCNQCWPPTPAAAAAAAAKPVEKLASQVLDAVGVASIKPETPRVPQAQVKPAAPKAPSTTPAPAAEASAKPAQLQFKAKIEAHVATKVNIGAPLGVGAESYGPKMCVSTWRNASTGRCMMQTDCVMNEDISTYEFGLICEEKEKKLVRHLFGVGTFKRRETFDTLIKCEQCHSLDDPPLESNVLVKALGDEVAQLQAQLRRVSKDVVRLDEHVFPVMAPMAAPMASPAGSPMAAPAGAPGPALALSPSPSPSAPIPLGFKANQASQALLHSAGLKKGPAPEPAKPKAVARPPTQAFLKKVEVKDEQTRQATLHSVALKKGPAPEPAKPKALANLSGGSALVNSSQTKALASSATKAAPARQAAKPAKPAAAAPKHEEAKDTLIRRGARWREGAMLKAQKEASALKAQQMALAKQIQQATQAVVLNAGKRQQHQGQQQRQQKAEVDEEKEETDRREDEDEDEEDHETGEAEDEGEQVPEDDEEERD